MLKMNRPPKLKRPPRRLRERPWKREEDKQLIQMVDAGMSAETIARKLRRTRTAIYSRFQHHERKMRAAKQSIRSMLQAKAREV